MSVTVTDLTQGPATLYTGTFGAVEPLDAAVNATPAASAWTDIGGTVDGSKLVIKQNYSMLKVDQIVDMPGARLDTREITIETNMAEPTLANVSLALNGGTIGTGVGFSENFEPIDSDAATQPTYKALLLHGWMGTARRMVIVRKMLSIEGAESEYKKDGQTVLKVKLQAFYVSTSTRPFRIIDA